jgi:hypothetical protein
LETAIHAAPTVEADAVPAFDRAKAAIPSARRLFTGTKPIEAGRPVLIGGPALGGNRLLRMFPEDGIFYLELASGSSEASRRHAAELLCGGRAECQVYGWRDAAVAPRTAQLDATARARLDFTFSRGLSPSAPARSSPPSATL